MIYKKMLTPNYGCVGATNKFTCSDTVFISLVMFLLMLTIVRLSFITKTLYQAKGLDFSLLRPHLLLKRPQGRLGAT